jgi:branched-chain amino acid transport system ATP-binding protein
MLEMTSVSAWFGRAQVVRDVSFDVGPGEVAAVVGPNGAGKTTLVRAAIGLHAARSGAVRVDGRSLAAGDPIAAARAGIAIVPQGRRVFRSLTVAEHLTIAARGDRAGDALSRDELFGTFPRLAERLGVRARALSGGEQQMLAIARAVCTGPSVLVLDEPTEGLAPAVVDAVGALVTRLAAKGVAVLLTEQQGAFPHTVASRVLHMHRGVVDSAAMPGRQEVAR